MLLCPVCIGVLISPVLLYTGKHICADSVNRYIYWGTFCAAGVDVGAVRDAAGVSVDGVSSTPAECEGRVLK